MAADLELLKPSLIVIQLVGVLEEIVQLQVNGLPSNPRLLAIADGLAKDYEGRIGENAYTAAAHFWDCERDLGGQKLSRLHRPNGSRKPKTNG